MATSPTAQSALSSVATRSKGARPGDTVAVLAAQQQESQLQMQKLIQTIEKLQQENALEVQRAAQAGGGAATQVANQVTQGLERAREESRRTTERAEDKDFAVQQQELNAKLQGDMAREAATMGAAIQASRERYINSIKTMGENQAKLDASGVAFAARTEEMSRAGKFASEAGRKRLAKRMAIQKQILVYGDNMFTDKHRRASFREHNESLEGLLKSDDPMALLNMQTDPLNLPMPEMDGPREPLSRLDDLTPDQQFELELGNGYPPGGVMFPQEENFGLPEGEVPNVLHPSTMVELLVLADIERTLQDKSLLREHQTKTMRQLIENTDRISKMTEVYKGFNKVYNIKTLQGVEASLEDFISDSDPAKFNDPSRYIMTRSLVHSFGGGSQGEEIAQIALEFFDGKREPKTDEDFFTLAAVESVSFNIHSHLATAIRNAGDPKKGGSFATQLVEQSIGMLGKDETLRRLGVDPSSTSLVDAQEVMQDHVLATLGMAGRMNEGMKGQALYKDFKNKRLANLQLMDIYAYRLTKEGTQRDARLGELMADLKQSPEEGGPELEQLQAHEAGAKEFEGVITLVDSFIGVYEGLGPNMHEQISGFISNHLDPVTTPDLKKYFDQTTVERQRSGYVDSAVGFSLFPSERAKRGKQKSMGQEFKEGGVPQVVGEKLPALIGMGVRQANWLAGRTAAGLTQIVGGEDLTTKLVRGAKAIQGKQPIPFPGETAQIKENLTQKEIQQLLRESNRGN